MLKTGSALALSVPGQSFDCALMVMLIYHLVGKDVGVKRECQACNARNESHSPVRGRLIVA